MGRKGAKGQSQRIKGKTEVDTFFVAEPWVDDPGQTSLNRTDDHAYHRQRYTHHFIAPAKPVDGKIVPDALYGLRPQVDQKKAEGQSSYLRMTGQELQRTKGVGAAPVKCPAIFF